MHVDEHAGSASTVELNVLDDITGELDIKSTSCYSNVKNSRLNKIKK